MLIAATFVVSSVTGATPQSLLPPDISSVALKIESKIRNVADVNRAGIGARIVLSSSNAAVGTTATISEDNDHRDAAGNLHETLSITVDHDVDFDAYPSFLVDLPQGTAPDANYLLLFFDGTATVAMRKISLAPPEILAFSDKLAFSGGFLTPFHAKAGETYRATLVSITKNSLSLPGRHDVQTVVVPPTSSVSAFVHANIEAGYGLPATDAYVATPGVTAAIDLPSLQPKGVSILASATSQNLQTALTGPGMTSIPYHLNLDLSKVKKLPGQMTVTLILPLTRTFFPQRFGLAVYDKVHHSWVRFFAQEAQRQGDLLRLKIPGELLSRFSGGRQYLLTLYAVGDEAKSPGPTVAVVGDSISVLTDLPQSISNPLNTPPGTCTTGWTGGCIYTVDGTFSWPGVVAQLLGAKMFNLARYDNGQTIFDNGHAPPEIESEVAHIPADADFVVTEIGRADLERSPDPFDDPSPYVPNFFKAIEARAPHAKIVMLGPMCIEGNKVDKWAAAEQALAPKLGAFIPWSLLPTCGDTLNATDHLHYTPLGNRKLGETVASVISGLMAASK